VCLCKNESHSPKISVTCFAYIISVLTEMNSSRGFASALQYKTKGNNEKIQIKSLTQFRWKSFAAVLPLSQDRSHREVQGNAGCNIYFGNSIRLKNGSRFLPCSPFSPVEHNEVHIVSVLPLSTQRVRLDSKVLHN
jgi:hypothetical protein